MTTDLTNHHNASRCPYCTDNFRFVLAEIRLLAEAEVNLGLMISSFQRLGHTEMADRLTTDILNPLVKATEK